VRHLVLRDDTNIFDAVRRQGGLCQLPILSPFNMSWWSAIRRRAQAAGASVMLTGELGNQSLNAGGLAILGDYTRRHLWRSWWREARANARRGDVRWRGILFNSFGGWLPERAVDTLRASVHHIASSGDTTFLRPEWLARLETSGRERFRPSGDSYADRLRLIRADDVGPYRKAAIADCGMEERDVMSDRRALEFSLTLPPDQMLRNGVSRPLARAALADRVPGEILQSPLRGLQSADWHLRLNQQAARDAFEEISARHDVAELLDLTALEQAIADWPRSGWDKGHLRWKYFIGLPAALATGIFLKEAATASRCEHDPGSPPYGLPDPVPIAGSSGIPARIGPA
jgi:asparagine synthase (glutamine-hydrolysing)